MTKFTEALKERTNNLLTTSKEKHKTLVDKENVQPVKPHGTFVGVPMEYVTEADN